MPPTYLQCSEAAGLVVPPQDEFELDLEVVLELLNVENLVHVDVNLDLQRLSLCLERRRQIVFHKEVPLVYESAARHLV